MNPRSPAPQASVIIRQHGKIPVILDLPVVLDYGPAYQDYNNRIIKTLQQMAADRRKRATIKSAVWTLRTLNRHADLMNPDAVKLHIANLKDKNGEPASDATKHKHIWNYNYFVKTNGLIWIRPKYKYDLPVPITLCSFRRYLANNKASSLIRVSMICFCPIFIRRISTTVSK